MQLPAGGNQIFDDDDLRSWLAASLNLIGAAMILGAGTDIAHRQIQNLSDQRSMRDAGGAGAHDCLALRIVRFDDLGDRVLHIIADLRIR